MKKVNRNSRQVPTTKHQPGPPSIRKSHDPEAFARLTPSWAVARIDRISEWGWDNISVDILWAEIHSKLRDFESMTWAEIMAKGSHNIEKYKLIPRAQNRLSELRLDDLGELFSLRLTGKKRIWGILNNGILRIIWYDPQHQIYPSQKKHT
ncbi:MAG: hypothetical protein CVT49_13785 [candidate division Zixibacteria bacterium HGW-Zixibacteria-1]|nr:MAG: hypothetical protein CVT49_13785 [candidate division Zixibacteria bacterium HGW-Zixibacteria-1]